MKSQYIIILTIIITLVVSILLLAKIEDTQRTNNQNFWSVYFVHPLGGNHDFVIDNKTPETKVFDYTILIDDTIVKSGTLELTDDERKLIDAQEFTNQKDITVIVTTDTDSKKEIYKK